MEATGGWRAQAEHFVGRWGLPAWVLLGMAATCAIGGCGKRPAADRPPEGIEAGEILPQVIAAYRAASSYSDRGVVTLKYQVGGRSFQDDAELVVKLVRPNKPRVRAYQLTLACDGEQLRAKIKDPSSQDMDGQFVVRPAPDAIALPELYADTVLYNVISSGLGRHPVQLELLLGEEPLKEFLQPNVQKRLLPEREISQRLCWRVAVTTTEGDYVFWVDREDFVLRRLEYATDSLAAQMGRMEDVRDVTLIADFRDAQLGISIADDRFQLDVPEEAKQVQHFVLPPQPLPSDLFGQTTEDFFFTDFTGARVSRDQLQGRIAVLVWVHDDANCQASLQELEKIRLKYKDDKELAFFVVCTQPSAVSNEALQRLLQGWGVNASSVRDLRSFGRDVFRIPGAPTLVVLNKLGVVQIVEAGFNPDLAVELPQLLDRIKAGEDIGSQIVAQFEREKAEYAQKLEVAGGDGESYLVELPDQPVAPRSEPQQLKMTSLWTNRELKAPGNILVLENAERGATILVFDGWRSVVELDERGQTVARRELDLPNNTAVSYLRTTLDVQGRRYFAASSFRGRQFHVFDERWERLFSYPDEGQRHEGVQDVQLDDLDHDGRPEAYVGFGGAAGVQRVSLDGKRLWSNRVVANVLSLAVAPRGEASQQPLLAAGDQGAIVAFNELGRHAPATRVDGRAVFYLFAARFASQGTTAYCGLTYSPKGNLMALGLGAELREVWSHELPAGVFKQQIQFVHSAALLDGLAGQWWIAAPDGSIHVVSDDGRFSDQFAVGEQLAGLAVTRLGQQGVLLVSAGTVVKAWSVEPELRSPAP